MALTKDEAQEIRGLAHEVREDIVRMVHAAACGHPGGPLGMADFLYFVTLQNTWSLCRLAKLLHE